MVAFHDKEIVEGGVDWFENILIQNSYKKFVFVNELKSKAFNI